MLDFFKDKPKIYGTYSLKGKPLVSYQAASFAAPLIYAGLENEDYSIIVQKHKYIFTDPLDDDYYTAALILLAAQGGLD